MIDTIASCDAASGMAAPRLFVNLASLPISATRTAVAQHGTAEDPAGGGKRRRGGRNGEYRQRPVLLAKWLGHHPGGKVDDHQSRDNARKRKLHRRADLPSIDLARVAREIRDVEQQ